MSMNRINRGSLPKRKSPASETNMLVYTLTDSSCYCSSKRGVLTIGLISVTSKKRKKSKHALETGWLTCCYFSNSYTKWMNSLLASFKKNHLLESLEHRPVLQRLATKHFSRFGFFWLFFSIFRVFKSYFELEDRVSPIV
jgi:hypothetical protein